MDIDLITQRLIKELDLVIHTEDFGHDDVVVKGIEIVETIQRIADRNIGELQIWGNVDVKLHILDSLFVVHMGKINEKLIYYILLGEDETVAIVSTKLFRIHVKNLEEVVNLVVRDIRIVVDIYIDFVEKIVGMVLLSIASYIELVMIVQDCDSKDFLEDGFSTVKVEQHERIVILLVFDIGIFRKRHYGSKTNLLNFKS